MNILVVEDEVNVSSFIKQGLEENDFQVEVAERGNDVFDFLNKQDIDIIVLDLILPDIHGLTLCKNIRDHYGDAFKIIMLTALNNTDHVVEGLNAGADDYLGKPFEFKELLARINALRRRNNAESTKENNIYNFIDLEINDDTKEVKRGGYNISLTPKEYYLLLFFVHNQNRVISRQELLENVWEIGFDLGTNIVDVYVNYLRKKIDKGYNKKIIHTVKGMGYCLKAESNEH